MEAFLLIVNIIICTVVIGLVLLQGKNAGLGSAWGGGGGAQEFQTRRGVDKLILRVTIFFVVCFFLLSSLIFVLGV